MYFDQCGSGFTKLKSLVVSSPILPYPKRNSKFVLDFNASNAEIGAIFSQVQNGMERVIYYYRRALTIQERQYYTTRREFLALVNTCRHFRVCL